MTKLVKQSSNIFIEINSFVKATCVVLLLKALECLCKRYFCCSPPPPPPPPLPQAIWIVGKDSKFINAERQHCTVGEGLWKMRLLICLSSPSIEQMCTLLLPHG